MAPTSAAATCAPRSVGDTTTISRPWATRRRLAILVMAVLPAPAGPITTSRRRVEPTASTAAAWPSSRPAARAAL